MLLTRARQEMVFFVPQGDLNDPSRFPNYSDSILEYLSELGIPAVCG